MIAIIVDKQEQNFTIDVVYPVTNIDTQLIFFYAKLDDRWKGNINAAVVCLLMLYRYAKFNA